MLSPSCSEVKEYLKEYDTVPVFYETLLDRTPMQMFSVLQEDAENCFILESVDNATQWGRYSFIGRNPREEIRVKNGVVTHKKTDGETVLQDINPLDYLKLVLSRRRAPRFPGRPKLTGGLIGYFGYDFVRYVEKTLRNPPKDDLRIPDADLFLFDEIAAFDHLTNKAVIIINIPAGEDAAIEEAYRQAEIRAGEITARLEAAPPAPVRHESARTITVKSNLSRERYDANLEKAKAYIENGDIFQAVLSQRFEVENPPDPYKVYQVLRSSNPSPYLYYFKLKDFQIVGASPEMLVNVTGDVVSTRPIAGTVARGATEEEDAANEAALMADPKETAEHMMLVDLGRNDVGRVAKFGTVKTERLKYVERYSKVMHLVSDVTGELQADKTAVDALASLLPAGTLSGAPKVRAMEIIDELEPVRRGLYGGTVGYLAFDGSADTCIAIRTVLFQNNTAYIQAGGGIVADSVPEKEFQESENKALAVINAIREAARL